MTIKFYGHPFSSYCMKALIALYENDIPFEWRVLSPEHPENGAEMAAMWPIQRFPVLVDGGEQVMEATAIIEYLAVAHPGPVKLIIGDPIDTSHMTIKDRDRLTALLHTKIAEALGEQTVTAQTAC